jgi:two-component system, NtrC family, response regulator AtoC
VSRNEGRHETRTDALALPAHETEEGMADGRRLFLLVFGEQFSASHPVPSEGSVVIGRSAEADVEIDDKSVSRAHARLSMSFNSANELELELEDLDSLNGTWIGDDRLAARVRVPIRTNVPMRLGSVTVIPQLRTGGTITSETTNQGYVIIHVIGAAQQLRGIIESTIRSTDKVIELAIGELEVILVDADEVVTDRLLRGMRLAIERQSIDAKFGLARFGVDGRDPNTLSALAAERAHGATDRETVEGGIVIANDQMRTLHELIARVAAADISVLLLGETGVGKEIVAEMIHQRSARANKPFLRLNCSALTETLLESELFGHERGAFTGATQQKPGLLEVAEGGIVFLDEIGEMQPATQAKLLRVLDSKSVMRVGGVKLTKIDVRVVSATNRDLEHEVQRGTFRQDLLYRINAMSILIPPLRERPSEIEPLARHFMRTISARMGRRPPQLSAAAIDMMHAYSWPGNVRELRNVIERALVFCGDEVAVSDLPWEKMSGAVTGSGGGGTTGRHTLPRMSTANIANADHELSAEEDDERRRIIAALDRCAGNQTLAAQLLNISRRTLIARIEKYDVPRPRKR